MKKILFLLPVAFLLSCTANKTEPLQLSHNDSIDIYSAINKEKGKQQREDSVSEKLGEYVYMDTKQCLHSKNECFTLRYNSSDVVILTTENEEAELKISSGKYAVHRIKIKELKINDLKYCCNDCINDDVYTYLIKQTELH